MSITVTFRGEKGRFAAINGHELANELGYMFGHKYDIKTTTQDRSHIKAAAKIGGGERTLINMRSREGVTLKSGETVFPVIQLKDQNYPGAALTVTFGLYRLVCANGLMAFNRVAEPIRVPHFKNRTETLMYLDRVIAASAEKVAAIINHVHYLQSQPVQFPLATVDSMKVPARVKVEAKRLIEAGTTRPEDNVNTVWGIYNFVNELDRTMARANSTAYLTRDENMLVSLAA